jgi:hypothetical protein
MVAHLAIGPAVIVFPVWFRLCRLRMKRNLATLTLATLCAAASAQNSIAPGGTSVFELPGSTSLYQVFGHNGSTNDNALDAQWVTFAAGGANVFTFISVTGGVNCCSDPGDLNTPDGKGFAPFTSSESAIGGINGISGANGNTQLPLVAMFGTEFDPSGGFTPPSLPAWDAANPTSLVAPLVWQVFYVGDGRAGFNDADGALLTFTAPGEATRLFVGFVDAESFSGPSAWYEDNLGTMVATVALVPEPSAWALMAGGLFALGLRARRFSPRGSGGRFSMKA